MRLLFLLGLVCFVPGIFVRDVWPTVESLYAQVAREMIATGEYIVPHANGALYSDKPPLFFWMSAAFRWLGFGAHAGQVVSALLATGAMLATAALARLWFSRTVAFFAAAILGTIGQFAWLGRSGALDAPLTFWTVLATYGFFAGRYKLFYASMAFGVLTKGPLGVFIPVLAILAARLAKLPRREGGGRHVLWGIPLTLGIIAAWVVPACIRGGEAYTNDLLFRQTIERATKSINHPHPWWWYFTNIQVFFPWLLPAFAAFPWAWRRREEPALRTMLFWFLLCFVMFSAFAGKRIRYLLPLMPALAIIVARAFEVLLLAAQPVRGPFHRLIRIQHFMMFGAGALISGLGTSWAFFDKIPLRPFLADALRPLTTWPTALLPILVGLALSIVGMRGMRFARRDDHRKSMIYLVAAAVALHIAIDVTFTPRINTYESPRPVSARIDTLVPPGSEGDIAIYPITRHTCFNLYSQRLTITLLKKREEIAPYLAGGPNRYLLLSKRLIGDLPENARVAEEHRVGRSIILLVTAR